MCLAVGTKEQHRWCQLIILPSYSVIMLNDLNVSALQKRQPVANWM